MTQDEVFSNLAAMTTSLSARIAGAHRNPSKYNLEDLLSEIDEAVYELNELGALVKEMIGDAG